MKALQTFIYGGVAAVILGVFCVWGFLQLYDAARSYSWPHVTGRIISSVARSKLMKGRHGEYIVHWPDVRYEYFVGDRRFVSDRIMFTHRGFSESATQRLVNEYPVDKVITVYFDPKNPESAVLERGIQWFFIPILAFAIILAMLMVWIIYADLRGQFPSQQGHPLVTSRDHATVQAYQYRGVIFFIVAMSLAAMFYKGFYPTPHFGLTITFAVLVLLYQLFR